MADDHKRLAELEHAKGTLQYGQTLQITPGASSPDLVIASKDLIRFVGDKTDVNAWRVYLGPWQTRPDIVVGILVANAIYADPTPWAPPEPRSFDAFADIPVYARIMFGAGGVQHTAYVDWPRRGLLLQVSGNYLQVNAFVNTNLGLPGFVAQMPFLQASMGPEPGGGDSTVPATYTYPKVAPQVDPALPTRNFQNFQIPPFARAFIPILDWRQIIADAQVVTIATQRFPTRIDTTPANDKQVWRTGVGGVYDQSFTINPFPIVGQAAGDVRIELSPVSAATLVGCLFLLDL